jgi:cytochrome c553
MWPAAQSEFIDLVTAAMTKARPEIKRIAKNAKGNFGPYATLDEVLDAVNAALPKYGLDLYSQTLVIGDIELLVTTLAHVSGQFRRATTVMRANPSKPQEYLSWATYFRRLHSACLCGVAADSDLDGAGLEGPKPKKPAAAGLARAALLGALTEKDRDTVLAKAAMSVVAGRMTEDEMVELRAFREGLAPREVANA